MPENKLRKVYRNICSIEAVSKELRSANQEIVNQINHLHEQLQISKDNLNIIRKNSYELIYANIFHDTIKHSQWFDQPLSLSAGAIGYNFAYILYRTLDEIKPRSILELGLGQSTKIINAYAKHFKKIKHHIVEHDSNWIDFFKRNTDMSEMSNIHLLKNYKKTYQKTKLNAYQNFAKEFRNQKFDLIVIDGPVGVGQEYSRMDVLDILPESLDKQFVILLDDCDRIGEQRTIELIEEKFDSDHINYHSSRYYQGRTDTYICVSEDLEFLCHV